MPRSRAILWAVALAFAAVALGYYWSRARRERVFGGRAWAVALVVLLLHVMNAAWLSAR